MVRGVGSEKSVGDGRPNRSFCFLIGDAGLRCDAVEVVVEVVIDDRPLNPVGGIDDHNCVGNSCRDVRGGGPAGEELLVE